MIGFRIIFIAGMSYLISLRLALEYWVSNLECIMFQSTGLVFTQLHHLSWRADFEQPMTHRSSGTFPKQCLQDCSRSCLVKGLAQDGTHLVPESHQVWLTRCLDAFYLCWCFSRKRLVCKRERWTDCGPEDVTERAKRSIWNESDWEHRRLPVSTSPCRERWDCVRCGKPVGQWRAGEESKNICFVKSNSTCCEWWGAAHFEMNLVGIT